MRGWRIDTVFGERWPVLAMMLALGAPLTGSCGGTSRGGGPSTPGGAGGAGGVSGAGALTGGAPAASGSSSGGVLVAGTGSGLHSGGVLVGGMPTGGMAVGGQPTVGGAALGGANDAGGEGPIGGAPPDHDGWACGDQTCGFGQSCIRCLIENQSPQRCVPNPDQDPSGYASAIAACEAPPYGRQDCDGPEDCGPSQYCVASEGARCKSEASTQHSCCFACNALTDCTLCHSDLDCPVGESCQPNQVAPSKGCRLVR